jgi:ribonucleoside-diphosphate reductase alpha chain
LTPEDRQAFLFNTFTAPDLYEAVFSADVKRFMDLYAKYEADPNFKKVYVDARKLTNLYMTQAYEVGTNYFFNPVEANRHTPFFIAFDITL